MLRLIYKFKRIISSNQSKPWFSVGVSLFFLIHIFDYLNSSFIIEVVRASDYVGKAQGKLRDHYRIGKVLGTGKYLSLLFWHSSFLGAFGEVRMCVHRESNAQRAVKVLRKSNMDEDEKRMLFNEINILKEIVSSFAFGSWPVFLSTFLSPD